MGGKAALCFGADRIKTMVTMTTESSSCMAYNGKNVVSAFSQSPLIGFSSNLQVTRTVIKYRMGSDLGQVGLLTTELFALECST